MDKICSFIMVLLPLLGTAKSKGGVISNYGNYGNRSSMRNDNIYSYAWKSIICSNYMKISAFYILFKPYFSTQ